MVKFRASIVDRLFGVGEQFPRILLIAPDSRILTSQIVSATGLVMFYRLFPDGSRQSVPLHNQFAGPQTTSCWIIGGGPSLNALPWSQIERSPAPRFSINLSGASLLRPTFWTSYDPTHRFHRSIYLDPGILKFVHSCRAMDLIPQTTFKVCEAPNLLCFDRTRGRGFHDFPSPGGQDIQRPVQIRERDCLPGITDWQDSFVQAIDIAYRLGFRRLYLAGCDMFIAPSAELVTFASTFGVSYQPHEPLGAFLRRCIQAGAARAELERHALGDQYHFNEEKPFAAAVQTDEHYFRVVQYLRLSRRALSLSGLELISVTPDSRLNDHFPIRSVEDAVQDILYDVGDPAAESTRGMYTCPSRPRERPLAPMRDVPPHHWNSARAPQQHPPIPEEAIPLEEG